MVLFSGNISKCIFFKLGSLRPLVPSGGYGLRGRGGVTWKWQQKILYIFCILDLGNVSFLLFFSHLRSLLFWPPSLPQLLLFGQISSHNITPHTASRLYLFKFLSHISDLEESLQELWQCLKQPPLFSSITSVTHSPFYKLELSKLLLYFLLIKLKCIN